MADIHHYERIHWRSHRGMLELDLLLLPFVEAVFAQLSPEERASYEQLLDETDPQIYAWLMGQGTVSEPSLLHIVNLIRNHAKIAH